MPPGYNQIKFGKTALIRVKYNNQQHLTDLSIGHEQTNIQGFKIFYLNKSVCTRYLH